MLFRLCNLRYPYCYTIAVKFCILYGSIENSTLKILEPVCMKVFISNTVSVLIIRETEIKYMAIDSLELHEFCNPYNLEII